MRQELEITEIERNIGTAFDALYRPPDQAGHSDVQLLLFELMQKSESQSFIDVTPYVTEDEKELLDDLPTSNIILRQSRDPLNWNRLEFIQIPSNQQNHQGILGTMLYIDREKIVRGGRPCIVTFADIRINSQDEIQLGKPVGTEQYAQPGDVQYCYRYLLAIRNRIIESYSKKLESNQPSKVVEELKRGEEQFSPEIRILANLLEYFRTQSNVGEGGLSFKALSTIHFDSNPRSHEQALISKSNGDDFIGSSAVNILYIPG